MCNQNNKSFLSYLFGKECGRRISVLNAFQKTFSSSIVLMFKMYGECINAFFYGAGSIGLVLLGFLTYTNSNQIINIKRFLINLLIRKFPNLCNFTKNETDNWFRKKFFILKL